MNSHLQIISGKFKGRKLSIPPNARPTQNRARIALFNMLAGILRTANHQPPATIWDAFAGSGAFGIEFLSRNWAAHAIFTDNDAGAVKAIERNLAGFGGNTFTIRKTNATAAAREFAPAADVVFVDAPYDAPDTGEIFIAEFAAHARPGAMVAWEMEDGIRYSDTAFEGFEVLKDKKYGRARFLIMQKIIPDTVSEYRRSKNASTETL
ncbi:MAG: RsmD family RNA methyltransferase [Alphaproteobacteria bacterium]|nr:RsmD family RNA methyltransferase [Alphaproteobacteria bacterium]